MGKKSIPLQTMTITGTTSTNPVLGKVQQQLSFLQNLSIAIVVVLFIGFAEMFVAVAGVLINDWNNKTSTYQELSDRVKEQNDKLNQIINQTTPKATLQPQPVK